MKTTATIRVLNVNGRPVCVLPAWTNGAVKRLSVAEVEVTTEPEVETYADGGVFRERINLNLRQETVGETTYFARPTGYVSADRVLHLFADADEMRAFIDANKECFSQIAWIEGVQIHG